MAGPRETRTAGQPPPTRTLPATRAHTQTMARGARPRGEAKIRGPAQVQPTAWEEAQHRGTCWLGTRCTKKTLRAGSSA
jgi:hypothetical protein